MRRTCSDWLQNGGRDNFGEDPCDASQWHTGGAAWVDSPVHTWMLSVAQRLSFPVIKTRLILQRYRADVRRVEPCFISTSMRTTASVSCALNWECDSALLLIIVPGQRIYRKENPLTSMARLFRHRRLECVPRSSHDPSQPARRSNARALNSPSP